MDNHQHGNHSDPAQARIKKKGIRQHKVNDQAQNIDSNIPDSSEDKSSESTQVSSPENQNYMSSANEPAINREGYFDLGDQLMQCSHCNANMWYDERISKHERTTNSRFSLCCGGGKVELPLLQNPPKYLYQLLYDHDTSDSKNYQQNIRTYNMMLAFTSAGIKFNKSINHSRGPPTIRIQGQPCHIIGSMLPMPRKEPKFAQLYIFDTENEVQNRINAISPHNQIQGHIVSQLSEMLDEYNVHAKNFRMARDRLQDGQVDNIKLKLIANHEKDGRTYNVPTVPEVAALIVGDFDANSKRDIIIETQHGQLQRIHELHCSYLALQYPLLFPYGEDGYRPNILHSSAPDGKKRKRNHLTMREWFSYKLQCISNESKTLLNSRRLFQQFVVEGYTMVESERLSHIRNNQKKLRVDKFCSLQQSLDDGSTKGLNKGKRVILPSTFVGSPRYIDQLYFDATYRPHKISRIFKLKYEQMLMDLTKNQMLGKVIAYEIDQIIAAEIPSQQDHPELHSLVKNHMVHGPCGTSNPRSPCMKEGNCSHFYPKIFQSHTVLDADGYPVYRRRNNGHTIEKNGVIIDNKLSQHALLRASEGEAHGCAIQRRKDARSRHQRLFVENVGKTEGNRSK
uniref:Helitron helicase-like domain-containing protein n=1 Tax=Glycine max TaxID=3847 RepID=A0A0R0L8V3_SOYBN